MPLWDPSAPESKSGLHWLASPSFTYFLATTLLALLDSPAAYPVLRETLVSAPAPPPQTVSGWELLLTSGVVLTSGVLRPQVATNFCRYITMICLDEFTDRSRAEFALLLIVPNSVLNLPLLLQHLLIVALVPVKCR